MMPTIWRNCIEAGTMKFAKCPDIYKEDVLALMREDVVAGKVVRKGKMTPELFEELTGVAYEVEETEEA